MSNFKEEIYNIIGQNVRKYRIQNNFSQEKLSEMLNANRKFIRHVERVERYISLKKLIEISQINKKIMDTVPIVIAAHENNIILSMEKD